MNNSFNFLIKSIDTYLTLSSFNLYRHYENRRLKISRFKRFRRSRNEEKLSERGLFERVFFFERRTRGILDNFH